MSDSRRINTINTFEKGMWQDSLMSLQAKGTYREAWSAVFESDEANSFGLTNELSNQLFVAIPDGFEVRGIVYAEERDQYVVFLYNKVRDFSEIGLIDEKEKVYKKKISDNELRGKLCFGEEFCNMTLKTTGQCSPLEVYWTNKDIYRYIDLDDPFLCDKRLEDTELFKCDCAPIIVTHVYDNGGSLPNGIYQFFVGLEDEDGNQTNFFDIGNPISIGDGDFIPGEISRKAISVEITKFKSRYSKIRLGVARTINQNTTYDIITTAYHGNGNFNYVYRNVDSKERETSLQEVRIKKDGYVKGKGINQYDGHLLLYNLKGKKNLDYQRRANKIKAKYVKYRVPLKYAHQFNGLRPWEKYQFGMHFNFCDGTKTHDYVVSGRECKPSDLEKVPTSAEENCSECELPRWRIHDTSERTDIFGTDSKKKSKDSKKLPYGFDEGYELDDRIPIKPDDDPNKEEEEDLDRQLDCECEKFMSMLGGLLGPGQCEFCEDIAPTVLTPGVVEKWCMCLSRVSGGEDSEDPGSLVVNGINIGRYMSSEDIALYGSDPSYAAQINTLTRCRSCSGGSYSSSSSSCGSCGGSGSCFECGGSGQCNSGACGTGDDCNPNDSSCFSCGGSGSCSSCSGLGSAQHVTVFSSKKHTEEMLMKLRSDFTVIDGHRAVKTESGCGCEGELKCTEDGICTTCKNGTWYILDNVSLVKRGMTYERDFIPFYQDSEDDVQPLTAGGDPEGAAAPDPCNDLQFEYIYDEEGCEIIGVKPLKYAEGEFGFWETQETYPLTKDCDGNFIYGELAGKRVRLHAAPGNNKEPHFLSCQNGVPHDLDPANSEFDKTYIDFIGVSFEGIEMPSPDELPKPLCAENPFTITIVPRTENDTSVLSSGLFINTFRGTIQGEDYAFAKHAVNSFEYYDRSIEPQGPSSFRGGNEIDIPAYIHHSPDLHLLKRNVGDAYNVVFDLEFGGWGYMYHHYYKGEPAESPTVGRRNQKGVTQHIHLNHYDNPITPTGVIRCVKGLDYVDADTVLAKGDIFKYSLVNLWRESALYIELEGQKIPMVNSIEAYAPGTQYGGNSPVEDGTSDGSFFGYAAVHEGPIYHANCHYGHILRYLPNQYGSIVGQSYEPLMQGTAADLACGKIEGLHGDSFCNYFSVKRTGYISDKVTRDIRVEIPATGGPTMRFFKKATKGIFSSIGIENCGTAPLSGQPDVRTATSLRSGRWAAPRGPIPPPSGSDIFYPAVLKTNILTYIPSDANLYYRQTGDEKAGEVYYPKLKSLKLDSKFPQGTPAEDAYLDRFYVDSRENPMYKMVLRAIFNFLFTYGIGFWILIKGLGMLGGGSYGLQTAFAIAVTVIGGAWIAFWSIRTWDNQFWDSILGIDGCWPDFKLPGEVYKMRDGRVKGFEDNYWRYNLDYSRGNPMEVSYGLPDPYNTCGCLSEYKSKLIFSAKQRVDSKENAWLNFKVSDYDEIPTDRGPITDSFQIGNRMFLQTTDSIVDMVSGSSELNLNNAQQIFLSNGDIFRDAVPIAGGITEGLGGTLDPNASITTSYGHFFIDRKAKTINMFNGTSAPVPISDQGLRYFLQKNLGLFLVEQFPGFKYVDNKHELGVGYAMGVDHKLNRLLITKIDYKAYEPEDLTLQPDGVSFKTKKGKIVFANDDKYFCNKSFTISYDLVGKRWIGFHYYHPKLYAWNRFDMYSFDTQGMWKHNVQGSFQTFYGEYFPFSVEYVLNDLQTYDAFSFMSSKLDAEFNEWVDYDYIRNSKLFFDKLVAFNSHQSTGEVTFRDKSSENIMEATAEVKDTVRATFKLHKWSFDGLRDKLANVSEHILDNDCVIGPRPVNKANLLDNYKNNKFVDNYLVNRLIFSKFDSAKINLKSIISEIERETN